MIPSEGRLHSCRKTSGDAVKLAIRGGRPIGTLASVVLPTSTKLRNQKPALAELFQSKLLQRLSGAPSYYHSVPLSARMRPYFFYRREKDWIRSGETECQSSSSGEAACPSGLEPQCCAQWDRGRNECGAVRGTVIAGRGESLQKPLRHTATRPGKIGNPAASAEVHGVRAVC